MSLHRLGLPIHAALIIVLLTAVRLLVAGAVGLGDVEAYYWTWSQSLQPGYLDHGPAVAWLIRAGTTVAGDGPFGVRLPFIVLSAATMWLLAATARRLVPAGDGARSALWTVLLLLAMPMFLVAGGAANPDVPFIFLVTAFAALLVGRRPTPSRLATAGAVAGLACLAKFFGLFLAVPLVVAGWSARRRPLAVIAGLAAMAVAAAPQLLWNAANGWPSVRYHFLERHVEHGVGPSLTNLGKLVGGQLAYVSPSVLAALGAALLLLRRRDDPTSRMLQVTALALALPGWLLIAVVPGAEPHWPAAGYLPLVLVVAGALPDWRRAHPRATRWLVVVGGVLSAAVAVGFHLHVLTDVGVRLMPASYEPRYDLANELVGWPRVGQRIQRAAATHGRPPRPVVVAGCHYTSCSQLAFALRRGPLEVHCPSPRRDQFDLRAGGDGSQRRDLDLLYLRDERFPFGAELMYRCGSVRTVDRIRIRRGGRVVRRFGIELCRDFSGLRAERWPPR